MKKLSLIFAFSFLLYANEIIKVGITPYPNALIMESIKDDIKNAGYELEVVEFNDYILPNMALNDGELDANIYQHKPFMDDFNESKGTKLVAAANYALAPMAAYSKKIKDIKELKEGALIYIPNDSTNESRALDILENAGLITTDKSVKLRTTIDITNNSKNLIIKELEAAQIPRVLDECDLAIINTNYALGAKLNPTKDSIILESIDSPYVNIIAVKEGDENKPKIQALIKAIQSQKVKDILKDKLQGALIPAF